MDPRLAEALAYLPESGAGTITELKGGITNFTYLVDQPKGRFVVRLGGPGTDLLGIDRSCEEVATLAAAQANLGADVILCDPSKDLLITRFLEGESLTVDRAITRLPALARAIRGIHALKPLPKAFSPFDTVRNYSRIASQRDFAFPENAEAALQKLVQVAEKLGPPTQIRPCHNDLLAANFIVVDGSVRIIDWEYAGMGDPYFDLANFAVNLQLNESQSQALLEAYFDGDLPNDAMARLTLMRAVSDAREAYWGFVKAATARPDEQAKFREYGTMHLDRFIAQAAEPAFEDLAAIPSLT